MGAAACHKYMRFRENSLNNVIYMKNILSIIYYQGADMTSCEVQDLSHCDNANYDILIVIPYLLQLNYKTKNLFNSVYSQI